MRIDKYLQVARIVKRRSISKEIIEKERVIVNGKVAKPGTKVKIGDTLEIVFGDSILIIRVESISEKMKKEDAATMYEIISREKRDSDA